MGILKPNWKPMAGAINTPCSSAYGPWSNRTWQPLSPLFSQMLASRIFFPFPFLCHGPSQQLSAHLQRGSQGKSRSLCCALVLNSKAEEWISDQVLPRQNGHFKWSCGLQWQRRLPTEGWPSKMLVYLYISVYTKCMQCTRKEAGQRSKGEPCGKNYTL